MKLTEFKRVGHWPTLLCAFVYFDTSFMVWTLLGSLGVFIAQDFHLTPGSKGLLVAVPLLGGSILRVVLGIATDHFGPRRVGLAGLALTLVPLWWGWLHSTSLGDLAGIGLMLGVAGASFAVALPLASRWYPPQSQGLDLGIAGAGNSGTVFAAPGRALRMARGLRAGIDPDHDRPDNLLAFCQGESESARAQASG